MNICFMNLKVKKINLMVLKSILFTLGTLLSGSLASADMIYVALSEGLQSGHGYKGELAICSVSEDSNFLIFQNGESPVFISKDDSVLLDISGRRGQDGKSTNECGQNGENGEDGGNGGKVLLLFEHETLADRVLLENHSGYGGRGGRGGPLCLLLDSSQTTESTTRFASARGLLGSSSALSSVSKTKSHASMMYISRGNNGADGYTGWPGWIKAQLDHQNRCKKYLKEWESLLRLYGVLPK